MSEQKQHLPPLFQKNEVLFGHDGAPGLIAFEIDGADKVTIFSRDGDVIRSETVPFQPLLLMAGDDGLKGWQGDAKIEPLAGNGAFNRCEIDRITAIALSDSTGWERLISGTKAKVKISENCKLASEWDPNKSDENVEHYMAKLKELYEKFRPFIVRWRHEGGGIGTDC